MAEGCESIPPGPVDGGVRGGWAIRTAGMLGRTELKLGGVCATRRSERDPGHHLFGLVARSAGWALEGECEGEPAGAGL